MSSSALIDSTRRYWHVCVPLLVNRRKSLRSWRRKSRMPQAAEASADRPRGKVSLVAHVIAILGAAYTLGSTLWLFRYGPRMLHFCANTPWLGKGVHRMIQADALPDYFMFQAVASVFMLVGHLCVDRTSPAKGKQRSAAWTAVVVALVSSLANVLMLGPMTVRIVEAWPEGTPALTFTRRFAITHGASMLLNVISMLTSVIFIILTA